MIHDNVNRLCGSVVDSPRHGWRVTTISTFEFEIQHEEGGLEILGKMQFASKRVDTATIGDPNMKFLQGNAFADYVALIVEEQ